MVHLLFLKNASFFAKKMRTCTIIVQNKEIFFALPLLVRIFAAEKKLGYGACQRVVAGTESWDAMAHRMLAIV